MNAALLTAALREYRTAVRNACYWEDHGTHNDGHLQRAKVVERKALAKVNRIASSREGAK